MNETLLMLRPYIHVELCDMSLEDLAAKYQESHSDDVLASSYNKIYKLSKKISAKYYGIEDDDLESYCLEKLAQCLDTYEPKEAESFVSYFCACYNNKLRTLVRGFSRIKRSTVIEPLDTIIDKGINDTYDLISDVLATVLSVREQTLVYMLYEGYNMREIAKQLGVSVCMGYKIKKSVMFKLSSLQSA